MDQGSRRNINMNDTINSNNNNNTTTNTMSNTNTNPKPKTKKQSKQKPATYLTPTPNHPLFQQLQEQQQAILQLNNKIKLFKQHQQNKKLLRQQLIQQQRQRQLQEERQRREQFQSQRIRQSVRKRQQLRLEGQQQGSRSKMGLQQQHYPAQNCQQQMQQQYQHYQQQYSHEHQHQYYHQHYQNQPIDLQLQQQIYSMPDHIQILTDQQYHQPPNSKSNLNKQIAAKIYQKIQRQKYNQHQPQQLQIIDLYESTVQEVNIVPSNYCESIVSEVRLQSSSAKGDGEHVGQRKAEGKRLKKKQDKRSMKQIIHERKQIYLKEMGYTQTYDHQTSEITNKKGNKRQTHHKKQKQPKQPSKKQRQNKNPQLPSTQPPLQPISPNSIILGQNHLQTLIIQLYNHFGKLSLLYEQLSKYISQEKVQFAISSYRDQIKEVSQTNQGNEVITSNITIELVSAIFYKKLGHAIDSFMNKLRRQEEVQKGHSKKPELKINPNKEQIKILKKSKQGLQSRISILKLYLLQLTGNQLSNPQKGNTEMGLYQQAKQKTREFVTNLRANVMMKKSIAPQ